MSPHADIALVGLKTITLLLGGLITYFSYKAYDRSGARPLWFLAVGFGVVSLGLFVGGILDQLLRFSLLGRATLPWSGTLGEGTVTYIALVVEGALTALGFAIIVYSLYSE
jgi:hypothetical protein